VHRRSRHEYARLIDHGLVAEDDPSSCSTSAREGAAAHRIAVVPWGRVCVRARCISADVL